MMVKHRSAIFMFRTHFKLVRIVTHEYGERCYGDCLYPRNQRLFPPIAMPRSRVCTVNERPIAANITHNNPGMQAIFSDNPVIYQMSDNV